MNSAYSMSPDWGTYFLALLTDPTVAYLLLLLGVYGIFCELVNPGLVLPGAIGTISLFLAVYAFHLLPVNYTGFALLVIGLGFIILEAFSPAFGLFGAGGTLGFIFGSLILMNSQSPMQHVALPVIYGMAVVNIVIFIIILGSVIKSRQQKVQNGVSVLIGAQGKALGDINGEGQALILGEIWSVRAKHFIPADALLRVVGASRLVLDVEEVTTQPGE